MKIRIDCDRRVKYRGSTEYEGGWYHYTVTGKQQNVDWKSAERWPTYAAARAAIVAAGHEHDNAGWKRQMLSWNFNHHGMDGYPGWEHEGMEYDRPVPAFVKLTHVRGKSGSAVESHDLANAWDDIAEVDFYQRDWTDDGIPFCSEGEVYWSGWWFATIAERDRFVRWHADRCRKSTTG